MEWAGARNGTSSIVQSWLLVLPVLLLVVIFTQNLPVVCCFVERPGPFIIYRKGWPILLAKISKTHTSSRTTNKKPPTDDILWVERGLKQDRGLFPILGSDESGRGCVAGPVVAATCAIWCEDWSDYQPIPHVRDSKELSVPERQEIYQHVLAHPDVYIWSVAERSNTRIDETNIMVASMECFQESIEQVALRLPNIQNAYSIVDGKKGPKLGINLPSRPWVQGDKQVYSVALASIIAKVTRDGMADEWHRQYPEYGFHEHKGYATRDHIEAIHKYGPCPIHRRSFKTLKGR